MADKEDADETNPSQEEKPLEPTSIAQFFEHDRCPRHLKQRVEPGEERTARDWQEAFGLMNIALLGSGREFEATQVEALAANAEKVIGPEPEAPSKSGVPAVTPDETWAASPSGRARQIRRAVEEARQLTTRDDDCPPYILLYQAPLEGTVGAEDVWGKADCVALAPADALPDDQLDPVATDTEDADPSPATTSLKPSVARLLQGAAHEEGDPGVVARVLDCKSANEEHAGHRIQVALYCTLLERVLAEGHTGEACRIEGSVLTAERAVESGDSLSPFELPTFPRAEWEHVVTQLLREDGPVDDALSDELAELPFTLDQVCDNCAYKEACATRAVEDPTTPSSLALLGLDSSVQQDLQDAGITNIRELSDLLERKAHQHPTDDAQPLDVAPETRRALEEALPCPIHETVRRAQALRGEVDPEYSSYRRPPAIAGKGWVPLPDDRKAGWGKPDDTEPGTLIHVALSVRPDPALDRLAALGACVYAEDHGEYVTVAELIDAVPNDAATADDVEADLIERFLDQLFDALEGVATAVDDPESAMVHCYTYTTHAQEALIEGLERHAESLQQARALRALCSLHPDGHTGVDQSMLSAVQPILEEYYALQYPSRGLLAVVEQFCSSWSFDSLDPLDARQGEPPLRAIFREGFLNERVPYLTATPGIRLHQARGPLAEGPAATVADTDANAPDPDGWYPVRKRAGGQFPLEYVWVVTPRQPGDDSPRLTPDVIDEWAVDEDNRSLYTQEINRYYYRTDAQNERLQRADVEYLVERLAYAFQRLIQAIPGQHKDLYHPKKPLDATTLREFDPPGGGLPAAARDYLGMEHGARRDATITHYRQSLRQRARTGRSVPFRCTGLDLDADGALTITGELAYDALFPDADTAAQVAQQTRIRAANGPGGGSWRVLTQLWPDAATTTDDAGADTEATTGPSARGFSMVGVEKPEHVKHSPPVLIEELDPMSGEFTCRAFPHRFRSTGEQFRVDHCGWKCPEGTNLADPSAAPSNRPGFIAGRPPVQIESGEVFMLDPMVDDFSAPKAAEALKPGVIQQNVLYEHLRSLREVGHQPAALVCPSAPLKTFVDMMSDIDTCVTPTPDQADVITATEQALLPVQGPPGTGKTSGATAPALLARARACTQTGAPFLGVVVAPSHEAVDAVLDRIVELLGSWRGATGELSTLEVVRMLSAPPRDNQSRVDDDVPSVDVTYCGTHTAAGAGIADRLAPHVDADADADAAPDSQWLVFATPSSLYHTLKGVATASTVIEEESATALMRHDAGLADVVCVDEASMLDLPRLLLAGSTLKPTGQTILVGDHRQLATVTQFNWENTHRKPLTDAQAYRSALDYVRWLQTEAPATPPGVGSSTRQADPDDDALATDDDPDTSGGEQ